MKLSDAIKKISHDAGERHCSCGCHEHDCCAHESESPRLPKGGFDPVLATRLIIAALVFAAAIILRISDVWSMALLIVSALVAGYDIVISAVKSAIHKHVFDENILMTVAAVAAFIIGEAHEGAAVLILFQFGELLQSYAVGRARSSVIESLSDRPETVTVIRGGREVAVDVSNVAVGETIVLCPGERIAFDCIVQSGESTVDLSSLTGESFPVNVEQGDTLLAGAVNLTGMLNAVVHTIASESTASRILNMVQNEAAKKGKTEKFITKFASIYTPIILILAILNAVLVPLLSDLSFTESIHRSLAFLVISCPCALVISVPMAYFAGIGGCAKRGIIFKSSAAADIAAEAINVIFDKTGTLTTGKLRVVSVMGERMDPQTLLKVAAHAEAYSSHPLARAIVEANREPLQIDLIDKFHEYPGKGVTVEVGDLLIAVGTSRFLNAMEVAIPSEAETAEIAVYMSIAGIYAGRITFGDDLKPEARRAIHDLENLDCHATMLTGDSVAAAEKVAALLDIPEYFAECLPEDKVERIHDVIERSEGKGKVLFVGEGLNDAPALLAADLGVAMGVLGTDAAIEAADAVILDDNATKVPGMIRYAKGIRGIVTQNICFAILIKVLVLIFAAFGYAEMWMAVFADVGTAILAIVNAMRARYIGKIK